MKLKNIIGHRGLTLAEVVVAIGITALAFGSIFAAYGGVKAMTRFNRTQSEAAQVVRSQIELLKATAFANINNATTNNVVFDPGKDGISGNADDRKGTLTVAVRDAADMDSDGNTAETTIDLDNDLTNDANAKPIRVTFSWTEYMVGQKRNFSVFLDTLVAG